MDYQMMKRLDELMNYQIKFIDYMDELIKFDDDFTTKNPDTELPPIQNIGVLKSHFITQKKACEAVLSITARHLPRLKAEHDKNKPVMPKIENKTQSASKNQVTISKKPDPTSNFMSLF